MEDIGGVWRTIGGRRVFIKTGQSLSSAMKESGKFNKKYDGSMKEEGKERYFEDKDGNKIEYLTTKEYNEICQKLNERLTDEERELLLQYVDTPFTAGNTLVSSVGKGGVDKTYSPNEVSDGYEWGTLTAWNKNPEMIISEKEYDDRAESEYKKYMSEHPGSYVSDWEARKKRICTI